MCLFIYTLPQLCGHTHFQNVAECPIARGVSLLEPKPGNRSNCTLAEPKFLFDTCRDRSHTPAHYSAQYSCKKRKAIRPVLMQCENCVRKTAAAQAKREHMQEESQAADHLHARLDEDGVASSGSSGSSVALMAASASVSDVGTSGTSAAFWLLYLSSA